MERQHYGKIVKEFGGEDTEKQGNAETLEGTDQISPPVPEEPQPVKTPSLKSRFIRNLRKIVLDLGIAVLAAVIVLFFQWVSEIRGDIRYLERMVEDDRGKIENLQTSGLDEYTVFVTKENLELKLQLIEKDLKATIPDVSSIEKKIEEIEKEIKELQTANQ